MRSPAFLKARIAHDTRRMIVALLCSTFSLISCDQNRSQDSQSLRIEYTGLANTSGITPDPYLLSKRASVDEINRAITDLKSKRVETVNAVRLALEHQIKTLISNNLADPDRDIFAKIISHIDGVENFAAGKITITIPDGRRDPKLQDELMLGVNMFKIWGQGMMGYGVHGIFPAIQPLDRWPQGVKKEYRNGNFVGLVDRTGTPVIPGHLFLEWKLAPKLIQDLHILLIKPDSELLEAIEFTVHRLQNISGKDFGSDPVIWQQWFDTNQTTYFAITR